MSRARTLKPGFFKNEELADLPPIIRLLFAGLWTLADREGRLEDRPKRIKAELFPYDNINVSNALQQLSDARFIIRYNVGGDHFIAIPTWCKHQNPHVKEQASTIPAPCLPGASTVQEPFEPGLNPIPYIPIPNHLNQESGVEDETMKAGAAAQDDPWIQWPCPPLVEAYQKSGYPLIDEDWDDLTRTIWGKYSFEQKQQIVASIHARIDQGQWSDPAYITRPRNYIKSEWRRPLVVPMPADVRRRVQEAKQAKAMAMPNVGREAFRCLKCMDTGRVSTVPAPSTSAPDECWAAYEKTFRPCECQKARQA